MTYFELTTSEITIVLFMLLLMNFFVLIVGVYLACKILRTQKNFLTAFVNVNQDNFKFTERREFPRNVATFAKLTGHTQPQGFFNMLRSEELARKHQAAKKK